jgi:hypothetical protein
MPMLDKIEAPLEAAHSGERPLELEELEALYTSGCAKILEIEADAMRSKRRLKELRAELRHLRTAIEFLQQQQGARDAEQ